MMHFLSNSVVGSVGTDDEHLSTIILLPAPENKMILCPPLSAPLGTTP